MFSKNLRLRFLLVATLSFNFCKSSSDLEQLYGIGEKLSRKLIKPHGPELVDFTVNPGEFFKVPKGTELTFEPILQLPLFGEKDAVGESLVKMSSLTKIHLDQVFDWLTSTIMKHSMFRRRKRRHAVINEKSIDLEYNVHLRNQNDTHWILYPVERSHMIGKHCDLAARQRLKIYNKIEDFVKKIFPATGTGSKSNCFLRVICEINNMNPEGLGFFGEIMDLLFRPSKMTDCAWDSNFNKLLKHYRKAEERGAFDKTCEAYDSGCSILKMK